MNKNDILSLILEVAIGTSSRLSNLRYLNEIQFQPSNGIIFPYYRKEKNGKPQIRICEQEARFIFVLEFDKIIRENDCKLYYAIETPTRFSYYGFAKKTGSDVKPEIDMNEQGLGSSGSIDLSIFDNIVTEPCLNIEFKCGPAIQHNFEKDLLKLYMEPADGVWFHIYDGNVRTKKTIEKRFEDAWGNLSEFCIKKKDIRIFLCDLRGVKNLTQQTLYCYTLTQSGKLSPYAFEQLADMHTTKQ